MRLLQHLPDSRIRLMRRSGLYFCRSRGAWARLLAKVYEVDVLTCSRCGSPMRVLAVITHPPQVRRILLHLIKTGVAPPGLQLPSLS